MCKLTQMRLILSVQCANWLFPSSKLAFENTQEKWCTCVQCHKAFNYLDSLNKHVQAHIISQYSPNLSLWWIGFIFLSPDFSSVFHYKTTIKSLIFSHNMHETSAPGPSPVPDTWKTGYPGRISGDIRPIWPDLGISTGFYKSQIPASLPHATI